MSTCGHSWCDTELRIHMDDSVTIRHRGTTSRFTAGADEVLITTTVLGDREPVIGIEIADRKDENEPTTTLVSGTATDAWALLYGLTDMIAKVVTDIAPALRSPREHG